jgi:hypothetical protein
MTKDQIKQRIVAIITDRQGCKAMELASSLDILSATQPGTEYRKSSGDFNLLELMNELVAERKVVEVEYVLPNLSYRAKSFYLPASTTIQVFPKSAAETNAQ